MPVPPSTAAGLALTERGQAGAQATEWPTGRGAKASEGKGFGSGACGVKPYLKPGPTQIISRAHVSAVVYFIVA